MSQEAGLALSVSLHLRDGRTDRQTPGIEFGASVTSGGNNFNEFPDNWPNFVYLVVDPGFYPLPLNFLNLFFKLKHCGLFPHRMDARDRHNGQRDERTNGRTKRRVSSSVRPSLRWSLTLTYAGLPAGNLSLSLSLSLLTKQTMTVMKIRTVKLHYTFQINVQLTSTRFARATKAGNIYPSNTGPHCGGVKSS